MTGQVSFRISSIDLWFLPVAYSLGLSHISFDVRFLVWVIVKMAVFLILSVQLMLKILYLTSCVSGLWFHAVVKDKTMIQILQNTEWKYKNRTEHLYYWWESKWVHKKVIGTYRQNGWKQMTKQIRNYKVWSMKRWERVWIGILSISWSAEENNICNYFTINQQWASWFLTLLAS